MTFVALVFWLALTGWVANDAARRQRHWFGWAALTWITSPIGVVVWLIVRRRYPVLGDRLRLRRRLSLAAAATIPLLTLTTVLQMVAFAFLFQFTRVAGHAMEPTLEDQERVVVDKWTYRRSDVTLGDIVMMYYPLKPEMMFVKRVIAGEGDTVHIIDGRVYVNDVLLNDEYVRPEFRGDDDFGPQVIAEGYFFVLGDHRNNSSDSRHWGLVPKKYVVGKIIARFGGARGWGLIEHKG
jgi:signal peptidase I